MTFITVFVIVWFRLLITEAENLVRQTRIPTHYSTHTQRHTQTPTHTITMAQLDLKQIIHNLLNSDIR